MVVFTAENSGIIEAFDVAIITQNISTSACEIVGKCDEYGNFPSVIKIFLGKPMFSC